ncbi:hypothetical protein HGRIS_011715 [Hohenbuehelia grisea]|uniref:Mitochondrial ATPase complex subunit ATP10 n=1 Tax=Hohenbuehelia grisea TaxID=104357 RepID=A0ABR3JWY2_9AGAR
MFFGSVQPLQSFIRAPTSCSRRFLGSSSRRLQENAKVASSSREAATREDPLPLLNRPLGVVEYPTVVAKSRAERLQDMLDHDKVIAERRHIIKEATKGYFDDLNDTRRHGGKTWIAPKSLIREDKSLYLPNITGRTLDSSKKQHTTSMCQGRITILAMLGTKISEIHTKGFIDPAYERYKSNPFFQFIQINLQENLLKSMLVNLFTRSLRNSIPPELHSKYLVSNQNMEYVRDPMSMTNSKVGYVYLIDENVKIRWGGCADAMIEETRALETCTGVLLNRLEKRGAALPSPPPVE